MVVDTRDTYQSLSASAGKDRRALVLDSFHLGHNQESRTPRLADQRMLGSQIATRLPKTVSRAV